MELPWNGRRLSGGRIAFDTETTVVDLTTTIPEFVCLSAHNGTRTVLVFQDGLSSFIEKHWDYDWIGWNSAFDWWVILQQLERNPVPWASTPQTWWCVAKKNRLHDGMLMEQLVRLGEGRDNKGLFNRSLKMAAKEYLNIDVEKDAEIRQGFTPEMAANFKGVDKKVWKYAANDAVHTWKLWENLEARAKAVEANIPVGLKPAEGVTARFGLLTEAIQVKASLALAQSTRNGFTTDLEEVKEKLEHYHGICESSLEVLVQYIPLLVKRYKKSGLLMLNPKNGFPKFNEYVIRDYLNGVRERFELEVPVVTRKDKKTGLPQMTIAGDWWSRHSDKDPVVKAWSEYKDSLQTHGLLATILNPTALVHPRYDIIKKTGRTSAKQPNIQQIPKEGWFRGLFLSSPGSRLVVVDYSAIELVTLATILEARFGRSVLADVLRGGRDPHSYTASLVLGEPYDEVLAHVKEEKKSGQPGPYSRSRQAAKAINFGVPGGLGPTKLTDYARANYGVDMSIGEARTFREKLIHEVYPELSDWLLDGLWVRIHNSLGTPKEEIQKVFGREESSFIDPMLHPVARLVGGAKNREDGQPFSPFFVDDSWLGLEHCLGESQAAGKALPSGLVRSILGRETSQDLSERLFRLPCVTLTGRVRLSTFYTEYRNTQFQGLASDGAKLALWELTTAGYKILAFIHDEVVVEVPEKEAEHERERICRIMVESFSRVLPTGVPVTVESSVSDRWKK